MNDSNRNNVVEYCSRKILSFHRVGGGVQLLPQTHHVS